MYVILAIAGFTVVNFGPFETQELAEAWRRYFDVGKTGLRRRTTYQVVPVRNPSTGGIDGPCRELPPEVR